MRRYTVKVFQSFDSRRRGFGNFMAIRHVDRRAKHFLLAGSPIVLTMLVGVVPAMAGPDACSYDGGSETATCTGDQSDGIAIIDDFPGTVETLIVDSDTTIAPAADINGIFFSSGTELSIDSIADFVTTGEADGINALAPGEVHVENVGSITSARKAIYAESYTDGNVTILSDGQIEALSDGLFGLAVDGEVTIDSVGTIDAGIDGIFAGGNGDIDVTSRGAIDAGDRGIFALSYENGVGIDHEGAITSVDDGIFANGERSIVIGSEGDITSTEGRGIFAISSDQGVSITSDGIIDTASDGISAHADQAASVTSVGDVTTGGRGLYAFSAESTATVHSDGTVESVDESIFAEGSSDVEILSEGALTSTSNRGIYARSYRGKITIDSTGAVTAASEGIFAEGEDSVEIYSDGAISSSASKGIYARAYDGGVTIETDGDISSSGESIFAYATSSGITITSDGKLEATAGRGIFAEAGGGSIDIDSTGMIDSNGDGIFAKAHQSGVSIVSDGAIDSTAGSGIFVEGNGGATIESTGALTATSGRGIFARATTSGGISIDSDGAIESGSDGIFLEYQGNSAPSSIVSVGDITAGGDGIFARTSSGGLTIETDGAIDADDSGIFAEASSGAIEVTSSGAIDAAGGYGIFTKAYSAGITIDSDGAIGSTNTGIFAETNSGPVDVTSSGAVTGGTHGIFASTFSGMTSVDSTGDVTGANGYGIYGKSGSTGVEILSSGDVMSTNAGIFADAAGSVYIDSVGSISSANSSGIMALSKGSGIDIYSSGDILAADKGIFAETSEGVSIESIGDITSTGGSDDAAIHANSQFKSVDLFSEGAVSATDGKAIFATALENIDASVSGDVSSTGSYGVFLMTTYGDLDYEGDGSVDAHDVGVFLSSGGRIDATYSGDITSQTTRGILATRVGAPGADMIDLTFGGGTVTSNGSSDAGDDTHAIQVDAAGGTSLLTILADGTVVGGDNITTTNPSYGVYFGGGTNNLVNWGLVRGSDLVSTGGRAIGGIDGDDTIDNHGTVIGSVYLGTGTNAFNNLDMGSLYSGLAFDLGGGTLTNDGMLSPGDVGTIVTTTFTDASLVQSSTGEFWVDMDPTSADTTDLLTGLTSADVDGSVFVQLTNMGLAFGSTQTSTIVAASSVTDSGIAGTDQGVIQVDVTTNATEVNIEVGLDFAVPALGGNQAVMAGLLQDVYMGGIPGPLTDEFLTLANMTSVEDYGAAAATLGPEGFGTLVTSVVKTVTSGQQDMFSCPVASGAERFRTEGQCAWANFAHTRSSADGSSDTFGFADSAVTFSAGMQKAMADDWKFGVSGVYERGSFVSGNASGDRDFYSVGAVVKNRISQYDVSFALMGGAQTAEVSRYVPLFDVTATSDQSLAFGSAAGRISHTLEIYDGKSYIEPSFEASATLLHQAGFTEEGAGDLSLTVLSNSEIVFRASPGIEVGSEFQADEGMLFRPFMRGGATFYSDWAASASLGGSTVSVPVEDQSFLADVALGLDMVSPSGWSLRGMYQGQFASGVASHSGRLKARVDF